MRRRAVLLMAVAGLVAVTGLWYSRRRIANGMPLVVGSLRACEQMDHVARQTTTVWAGTRPLRTEVEVAYRRPCLRRMVFLTAPLTGVTVLEDGQRTVRLDPQRSKVVVGPKPGAPEREARRVKLLTQNYRAVRTGEEIVAGRRAYRLELRPRYPGNPWKRLWIDTTSSILLASEDFDGAGSRTRSSRVETLSFRREPESAVRPSEALVKRAKPEPASESEVQPPGRISQAVKFPVLRPSYLPPGYELEAAFVYACQCGCGVPAARLQYGDGLNTLSVLECGHLCQHESPCGLRALPQGGAVRVIAGTNTIVVVGEQVRSELEKVANSIPGARRSASA